VARVQIAAARVLRRSAADGPNRRAADADVGPPPADNLRAHLRLAQRLEEQEVFALSRPPRRFRGDLGPFCSLCSILKQHHRSARPLSSAVTEISLSLMGLGNLEPLTPGRRGWVSLVISLKGNLLMYCRSANFGLLVAQSRKQRTVSTGRRPPQAASGRHNYASLEAGLSPIPLVAEIKPHGQPRTPNG